MIVKAKAEIAATALGSNGDRMRLAVAGRLTFSQRIHDLTGCHGSMMIGLATLLIARCDMTTARVRNYAYQAALRHSVPPALVLGDNTSRAVCMARWEVMNRLRQDGFTISQIGRWLGKHHTTVIHGLTREAR